MLATLFNRLAMFRAVKTTLEKHKATWENKPPLAFTDKVGEFLTMLGDLEKLVALQEADITGVAELKDKERDDVAEMAYDVGETLSGYFDDINRPDLSNPIDFSESGWANMRDERLLATSQTLLGSLRAALSTDAAALARRDLSTTDADELEREIAEYKAVIGTPQAAEKERSTITEQLPQEFRKITRHLAGMNKTIRRFRRTPAGRAFMEAYLVPRPN
jgi:hypothetical protein